MSINHLIVPGDLRHRITLYSSTLSPDGIGGGARTTVQVATVWARMEPTSSREVQQGGGIRGQTWWRVTIRYPDFFSVTPDMHLTFQGRTFYIKGILQSDAVNRWLVLDCMEGE